MPREMFESGSRKRQSPYRLRRGQVSAARAYLSAEGLKLGDVRRAPPKDAN